MKNSSDFFGKLFLYKNEVVEVDYIDGDYIITRSNADDIVVGRDELSLVLLNCPTCNGKGGFQGGGEYDSYMEDCPTCDGEKVLSIDEIETLTYCLS